MLYVHAFLYAISVIPDELFGQCLTQQQERFRYRVTAGLLDRLQSLLQMLMKKGPSHTFIMAIWSFIFNTDLPQRLLWAHKCTVQCLQTAHGVNITIKCYVPLANIKKSICSHGNKGHMNYYWYSRHIFSWQTFFVQCFFVGLTWQDEATQSIVDKELSMVEKIPLSSVMKNTPSSK